ncbi:GroES-like protein [Xylariaceae sp. FL0804]|nr:GroES-like protein [Xylariaceae sp. FL0804]
MNAVGVREYGPISNLQHGTIPRPPPPTGRELRVQVKAVSVNPIDVKVRNGTYDDAPDYYERVAPLTRDLHVMGYDGAGVVLATGPDARFFRPGDEVFFLADPVTQGTYAEECVVDERHAGRKPRRLDFAQAAAMPLTWGTAVEALVERLGIARGEVAGLLIVNGGGGVGSVASQVAARVLRLPVVVTTASRPETEEFSRRMGATHVVSHGRGGRDLVAQVRALDLPADVPLKYCLITSRTEQYLQPVADLLVPFGRVCSIVQARFDMYGTQFMSKSLTFAWCWVGTGPYHRYDHDRPEKHHEWYEELAGLVDDGTVQCHLTRRMRLTAEGIREAHGVIESGKAVGKIALGVDEPGEGAAFC